MTAVAVERIALVAAVAGAAGIATALLWILALTIRNAAVTFLSLLLLLALGARYRRSRETRCDDASVEHERKRTRASTKVVTHKLF